MDLHALSLWSDAAGSILRIVDPNGRGIAGGLGRVIGDIEGLAHCYRPPKPLGPPISVLAPEPSGVEADGRRVLYLLNKDRMASRGLAPLEWDERLAAAALSAAQDIARRRVLTHIGSNGSTPSVRIARAGFAAMAAAENAAMGYPTPAAVAAAWQLDAPHRANDLGPYQRFGLGVAPDAFGALWWVADFATPAA